MHNIVKVIHLLLIIFYLHISLSLDQYHIPAYILQMKTNRHKYTFYIAEIYVGQPIKRFKMLVDVGRSDVVFFDQSVTNSWSWFDSDDDPSNNAQWPATTWVILGGDYYRIPVTVEQSTESTLFGCLEYCDGVIGFGPLSPLWNIWSFVKFYRKHIEFRSIESPLSKDSHPINISHKEYLNNNNNNDVIGDKGVQGDQGDQKETVIVKTFGKDQTITIERHLVFLSMNRSRQHQHHHHQNTSFSSSITLKTYNDQQHDNLHASIKDTYEIIMTWYNLLLLGTLWCIYLRWKTSNINILIYKYHVKSQVNGDKKSSAQHQQQHRQQQQQLTTSDIYGKNGGTTTSLHNRTTGIVGSSQQQRRRSSVLTEEQQTAQSNELGIFITYSVTNHIVLFIELIVSLALWVIYFVERKNFTYPSAVIEIFSLVTTIVLWCVIIVSIILRWYHPVKAIWLQFSTEAVILYILLLYTIQTSIYDFSTIIIIFITINMYYIHAKLMLSSLLLLVYGYYFNVIPVTILFLVTLAAQWIYFFQPFLQPMADALSVSAAWLTVLLILVVSIVVVYFERLYILKRAIEYFSILRQRGEKEKRK